MINLRELLNRFRWQQQMTISERQCLQLAPEEDTLVSRRCLLKKNHKGEHKYIEGHTHKRNKRD